MSTRLRPILIFLLVCVFSMLLTACALRSLFGNVIIVEDIEEEVNEIITTVFSDSSAAVCLDTDYGFYECTYILDGDIITSTLYLVSEFGIAGVLIDPLILQIPADVSEIRATYDDKSGPKPLNRQIVKSFFVTPDIIVTAETDQKFLILELPATVSDNLPPGDPDDGPEFAYSLIFTHTQPIANPIEPMEVKVMLAGKVIINEHNYYVPLVQCVTNFASIPALVIPESNTPVDLQPAVGDLVRGGGGQVVCDHQAYYFINVPPPPKKVFLPVVFH